MITNDKGIVELKHFILREVCRLAWEDRLTEQETEKILVERYGRPEEVAHLVRFLISDEADYINNTVIRIDGGQKGSC